MNSLKRKLRLEPWSRWENTLVGKKVIRLTKNLSERANAHAPLSQISWSEWKSNSAPVLLE
jgi:hypothetical protein